MTGRHRPGVLIGVCAAGVALAVTVVSCGSSGTKKTAAGPTAAPTSAARPTGRATPKAVATRPTAVDATTGSAPTGAAQVCPAATVTVSDSSGLKKALSNASPGQVIRLADGTYKRGYVLAKSGTAAQPIWLCGSRAAVIDGGGGTAYLLHLDKVSYVRVAGFTVQNGKKGVVADRVTHSIVSGLYVNHIGDEAIHLRAFSTDNLVVANIVRNTGNLKAKFGEGIYVGSAKSNWSTYSGGNPDQSDRNSVIGNNVADTTAENIDIKEGTSGGLISGNRLSSEGMTSADSWIDVKGNKWIVQGNVGTGGGELKDGIQTHVIVDGDGVGNVFRNNRLSVDAGGYGIYINKKSGNTVACSNVVAGAVSGSSNVTCSG